MLFICSCVSWIHEKKNYTFPLEIRSLTFCLVVITQNFWQINCRKFPQFTLQSISNRERNVTKSFTSGSVISPLLLVRPTPTSHSLTLWNNIIQSWGFHHSPPSRVVLHRIYFSGVASGSSLYVQGKLAWVRWMTRVLFDSVPQPSVILSPSNPKFCCQPETFPNEK